jgi:hypothetical protein
MSKCNWTNELVNDLIDLIEEREVIWNAKATVYHDQDKRKEAVMKICVKLEISVSIFCHDLIFFVEMF